MNNKNILIIFFIFLIILQIENKFNKKSKELIKNTNYKIIPKKKKKVVDKKPYIDNFSHINIVYKNSKLIKTVKSKFQKIQIYYDKFFGYMLIIDNDVQITEHDQYIYHEMIVNFPLNYNHNGKKVLVIGGGDCGTVTEICKFNNIEEIIWIEIDKEVINICEKYFPHLSTGRYDKRTKLFIEDGAKWVKNNLEKYKKYFDFIIIDSSDYNTALTLFTFEFYSNVSKLLSEKGILNFNYSSIFWDDYSYMAPALKKIFKYVDFYKCNIPTYASGGYLFCFCSNKINVQNTPIQDKSYDTLYYNKNIHKSSLVLHDFYEKNNKIDIEPEKTLGYLYTFDVKNINSELLDNIEKLDELLNEIVKIFDLNILSTQKKKFKPIGVTILKLLSESHISIHTWPEYKKCSIDLFTCGKFKWNHDSKNNIIIYLMEFFNINENSIKFNYLNRSI